MPNIFAAIGGFFKKLGKLLGSLFVVIASEITEDQLDIAIEYARQAATTYVDNAQRRHFVMGALKTRFKFSESIARLAVELAVQAIKKGIDKAASKADEHLNPSPAA